jgi:hypothetical protein
LEVEIVSPGDESRPLRYKSKSYLRYLISRSADIWDQLNNKAVRIHPHPDGYRYFDISGHRGLHRAWAVLESWEGPPPDDGMEPDHKNRDRADDHLGNLQWKPRKYNRQQRVLRDFLNRDPEKPFKQVGVQLDVGAWIVQEAKREGILPKDFVDPILRAAMRGDI